MLLLGSLKVMVLGLGAAFAGLALLIVFVELMHKAINNKKGENNDSPSPKDVSQNMGDEVRNDNTDIEDDELIAVIAAAVAAALHRSTHDIIVKSVRRIGSHSPVWNQIGRQEQIRTRL